MWQVHFMAPLAPSKAALGLESAGCAPGRPGYSLGDRGWEWGGRELRSPWASVASWEHQQLESSDPPSFPFRPKGVIRTDFYTHTLQPTLIHRHPPPDAPTHTHRHSQGNTCCTLTAEKNGRSFINTHPTHDGTAKGPGGKGCLALPHAAAAARRGGKKGFGGQASPRPWLSPPLHLPGLLLGLRGHGVAPTSRDAMGQSGSGQDWSTEQKGWGTRGLRCCSLNGPKRSRQ